MHGLNLLSWREKKRKRRKYLFLSALSGSLLSGSVILFIFHIFLTEKIQKQNTINFYLQLQIDKLNKQTETIQELTTQKKGSILQQELIHQLQANRTLTAAIFEEIIQIVPDGLYLTLMKRTGSQLLLEGNAKSSAAISTLMLNTTKSLFFKNPKLQILKTDLSQDAYKTHFIIELTVFKNMASS